MLSDDWTCGRGQKRGSIRFHPSAHEKNCMLLSSDAWGRCTGVWSIILNFHIVLACIIKWYLYSSLHSPMMRSNFTSNVTTNVGHMMHWISNFQESPTLTNPKRGGLNSHAFTCATPPTRRMLETLIGSCWSMITKRGSDWSLSDMIDPPAPQFDFHHISSSVSTLDGKNLVDWLIK